MPGLVRSQAAAWVKTNLDKQIALGEIRFNPLTFTLDVNDIAIPAGSEPLVAAGHLRVSFSILSLFQSAWGFSEVRLDRPFVRAVIRPDGALNLIELVPRTHSEGPSPAVRIGTVTVDQGRIVYADRSQPGRPEEILAPISFTLKDFHTKSDQGGDFTLTAQSERGEHFGWTGTLSIAPIASKGRLTVAVLRADTIQKFLGARLPVVLTDGQIGFRADYDFAYDATGMRFALAVPDMSLAGLALEGRKILFDGAVKLDGLTANIGPVVVQTGGKGIVRLNGAMPRVAIQGLTISPPGAAPDQAITLKDAALTDSRFDMPTRRIDLGSLSLDEAQIYVRRDHGGGISLMAMLPPKPPKTASAAAPVAAAPVAAAPGEAPNEAGWKIGLKSFALNDAAVTLDDRAVKPAARLTVAPITIAATGPGDLTQPLSLHFDAGVNGNGHVSGEGTVTPGENGSQNAGDIKFTLAHLPLRAFAGYVPPMPGLDLRSGGANASGTVHFEGGDMAALRFTGDAGIENFSLIEITTKSPLFAWRAFSLTGIDYGKNRVDIGRARLVAPLGQVAVLADRRFNFTSLMAPPAAQPTQTMQATVPIQAKPSGRAAAKPGFLFRLKRLDIERGTMGFADYSIDPNFQARIEALQGQVSNITNKPGEAAAIDLSGQVIDRFSPVTIKGRMDLLGYDQLTDMQLAFRNIDLPVFNPYSGRYAGYAIAKGKLTTELSYKIDHRALKADQHVIIDQLEWGQATESKDRVPLPVRLATALLKDKDGVIDLDLPLAGSLDDPSFSVWPIVWKIVGNIIEKAVAAPFQLIGSLFAGADKAQFIDFAPGQASLPPGSADALGALAKALAQRPVLKLDIPAGPGTPDDAASLADVRIDIALVTKKGKPGTEAEAAALDAGERHDRLEALYATRIGKDPKYPEFPPDALKNVTGAKPGASDDDRRTLLETQWLREQLRPVFTPSNAELAALGASRAAAVRNALLADGSVDPARVFPTTAVGATATDGHARLALKFE